MLAQPLARWFGGAALPAALFQFQDVDAVRSTLARCRRSAVAELLKLAQAENGGFLNAGCINAVAALTQTPASAVHATAELLLHPKLTFVKKANHTIEYCGGAACRVGVTCLWPLLERVTAGKFAADESEIIHARCSGIAQTGPGSRSAVDF
jgi:NADH:ubiquinone oxidoreductase subunit E